MSRIFQLHCRASADLQNYLQNYSVKPEWPQKECTLLPDVIMWSCVTTKPLANGVADMWCKHRCSWCCVHEREYQGQIPKSVLQLAWSASQRMFGVHKAENTQLQVACCELIAPRHVQTWLGNSLCVVDFCKVSLSWLAIYPLIRFEKCASCTAPIPDSLIIPIIKITVFAMRSRRNKCSNFAKQFHTKFGYNMPQECR